MPRRALTLCLRSVAAIVALAAVSYIPRSSPPVLQAYAGRASEAPLHAEAPCAPLPNPDEYPASRIGYLEHRGRAYAIEALTDPQWAQLSEDPFVRGFMDHAVFAKGCADLNVEEPAADANWAGLAGRTQ